MMMLLMRRRMKLYFHPSRSVRLDNVQMLLAARGRLPHTPGHWSIKATDVRQPPPMPSECSLHNAGGWDSKEGPSGERVSQLVRRPYRDPGVCAHPFRFQPRQETRKGCLWVRCSPEFLGTPLQPIRISKAQSGAWRSLNESKLRHVNWFSF